MIRSTLRRFAKPFSSKTSAMTPGNSGSASTSPKTTNSYSNIYKSSYANYKSSVSYSRSQWPVNPIKEWTPDMCPTEKWRISILIGPINKIMIIELPYDRWPKGPGNFHCDVKVRGTGTLSDLDQETLNYLADRNFPTRPGIEYAVNNGPYCETYDEALYRGLA